MNVKKNRLVSYSSQTFLYNIDFIISHSTFRFISLYLLFYSFYLSFYFVLPFVLFRSIFRFISFYLSFYFVVPFVCLVLPFVLFVLPFVLFRSTFRFISLYLSFSISPSTFTFLFLMAFRFQNSSFLVAAACRVSRQTIPSPQCRNSIFPWPPSIPPSPSSHWLTVWPCIFPT